MSEIKISNRLLSWVLNLKEGSVYNVRSTCGDDEELEIFYFDDDGTLLGRNLDTFIRLAKIKAFECGYELETDALEVTVYYNGCNSCERFVGLKVYDLELKLKSLEWVAEKVEGEK